MRRAAFAILSTIAGLVGLLSFKTHSTSVASPPAAVSTTGPGTSSGSGGSDTGSGSSGSAATSHSPSPGSTKSSSSSKSTSSTKTVTGDAVDTRFGPVQVRITVTNGKVISATAVEYPNTDPRDQQINAYAIPVLQKETVGATSASIDMVSGATYTSEGYLQSLQNALNKAGL